MKKTCFALFILSFTGCEQSGKFDKTEWRENNASVFGTGRKQMAQDLLSKNTLNGLTKDAVISLLGKPNEEEFRRILPDSMEKSLHIDENTDVDSINNIYRTYGRKDHVLVYQLKQESAIHLYFLDVRLNNDRVDSCWIRHVQL